MEKIQLRNKRIVFIETSTYWRNEKWKISSELSKKERNERKNDDVKEIKNIAKKINTLRKKIFSNEKMERSNLKT